MINVNHAAYARLSGIAHPPQFSVAAGFDGFVDLLARPVKSGRGAEKKYFETIGEFGAYLAGKAALSCSLELERITEKFGGNMPLYASALSALAVDSHCIGALGHLKPDGVFAHMGSHAHLQSVAAPGRCTALEFSDGKVMMSCGDDLSGLHFDLLKREVGLAAMTQWLRRADAAAFLNWSELRGSTSIWRGLIEQVLPAARLPEGRWLLLDVSDCSRRTGDEIREMVSLVKAFRPYFKVVFSANANEALTIGRALGAQPQDREAAAKLLFDATGLHLLVLHLLDGAFVLDRKGGRLIAGRHVACPLFSTGGGDHFNAGLTWALLHGFSHDEAAAIACIAGSYYVQNGKSPTREALQACLESETGVTGAV